MPRADQAEHKRSLVVRAFVDAGVADAQIAETVSAGQSIGYRSKVVLVAKTVKRRTIFGGYQRGSHFVLDLDGCVIEEPILAAVATWMRRELAGVAAFDERTRAGDLRYVVMRSSAAGEALVTWIGAQEPPAWATRLAPRLLAEVRNVRGVLWATNTRAGNAIWDAPPRVIAGADRIEDIVHGLRFSVSPRAFFQVHRAQASALRDAMLRELGVVAGRRVWDLYCGVGVNALLFAKHGARVTGLESVDDAVQDADRNARANDLSARFLTADLDSGDALRGLEDPEIVVVNPPRKGAPRALIEAIAARGPAQLAYIACAPKPLAAGAAWLRPLGYVARTITPFDLFPHTEHVETLAIFTRTRQNAS
ncbi:MAG: class I SAM-dependent RNA methyltransferase [Deltaproteobacteria bacterium]|nr:class I SAM-dependent RNA methyltransferase [Deltaproteobacteria bacterium]